MTYRYSTSFSMPEVSRKELKTHVIGEQHYLKLTPLFITSKKKYLVYELKTLSNTNPPVTTKRMKVEFRRKIG